VRNIDGLALDYEQATQFTYAVALTGATATVAQSVVIDVLNITPSEFVIGTDAGETIIGDIGGDVIVGRGGADKLYGGTGGDALYFDNLDTVVSGGTGFDFAVVDGPAAVTLSVTDANSLEVVVGNIGDDIVNAATFTKAFYAYGGDGKDQLTNGQFGGSLSGDAGNDILTGGNGSDVLVGGAGIDQLIGGKGNDALYFDLEDTVINGGEGIDYAILDTLSLPGQTIVLTDAASIEIIVGNVSNDTIDATATTTKLLAYGGGGDDTIKLGSGGEWAYGQDGEDVITGGTGNDVLYGNAGIDKLYGGGGDDSLFFNYEDAVVEGGAGYDFAVLEYNFGGIFVMTDTQQLEVVVGNGGSDGIDASQTTTKNYLYGGDGADTITLGSGGGNLVGEGGNDKLIGGSGINQYVGGSGDDTFVFADGGGIDYIFDFDATAGEHDMIDLRGSGVTDFANVLFDTVSEPAWTVITAGTTVGWVYTGTGSSNHQFTVQDFILV
jgi:Ca2+-binding RTX toxin-like protein